MKNILPLIALISFLGIFNTSCKSEKACRCIITTNAENRPEPLFEIIYIKEDENCSSYDDVSRVYASGEEPNDTIVNFVQTTTTCTDRLESFPQGTN
ncbi:MAG: hypothetical protein EA358_01980 [Flavobacteriales bacterium]|nr:MAG: hypothetical protein EA358_01980 [Flavobacteriales bacterium]